LALDFSYGSKCEELKVSKSGRLWVNRDGLARARLGPVYPRTTEVLAAAWLGRYGPEADLASPLDRCRLKLSMGALRRSEH